MTLHIDNLIFQMPDETIYKVSSFLSIFWLLSNKETVIIMYNKLNYFKGLRNRKF